MTTRLNHAKPSPLAESSAVPANTTPADAMSPSCTTKVSIACFALYLSAREVGSHSSCRPGFAVIRWAKIFENTTDYSVMNTGVCRFDTSGNTFWKNAMPSGSELRGLVDAAFWRSSSRHW